MFFIHLLVLLIVFLSQASSISSSHTALPHQQQNSGILHQIRFFGCKLKKTNGGILLCDPSAFLRPRERHTLRQRMKQFLAETGNPGEQNDCRRRGVAVGVVLLDRRSDEEVQAIPRQSISDLARQLDPECDKFVQLLLPANELNRTAIIHGSGVPLQEEQLQLVIELQKSLLQQNRYFEAISGILEGIHLLLENTDAHQREQNIKSDKLGGQREETMTQASLALVASCAVLFSLMLSICTFAAFYYVAIVRDGGLACWGDAGSKAPRSGVYFVKEVSIEETTVDFCGEKTPP